MRRRTLPVLVVVCLTLLVAAVGAAVAGPWEMEERNYDFLLGWLQPNDGEPIELGSLPEFEPDLTGEPSSPPDLSWLRTVMIVLGWVAVAAFVAWVVSRFRRSASPPPATVARSDASAGPEEPEVPEIPVLQRGVAAARRILDDGADPADAIIRAWLALEEAAASAGVRRNAAQTPTEFVVAMLNRTRADPAATQRLLALYRRARFSRHPSTAADVDEAVRCLTTLGAGWETPVAAESRGER